MSSDDVARAVRRMAHEILERNQGSDDLVVVGMQTGGIEIARAIAAAIGAIEGTEPPTGTLDATMHRDDFALRPVMPEAATDIPGDPTQPASDEILTMCPLPRSIIPVRNRLVSRMGASRLSCISVSHRSLGT